MSLEMIKHDRGAEHAGDAVTETMLMNDGGTLRLSDHCQYKHFSGFPPPLGSKIWFQDAVGRFK